MFYVCRYQGPRGKVLCKKTSAITQEDLPSKRAYPERCDFGFAQLLKMAGLRVFYTEHNPNIREADFYGRLPDEVAENPNLFPDILKGIVEYSFGPIDFDFRQLTDKEKEVFGGDPLKFKAFVQWARGDADAS